jgi:spore coat protein U-like protein
MSRRRPRLVAAAIVAVGVLACHPAAAITTCTVVATPVAFTNYAPLSTSPNQISGVVTVNCIVALGITANWTVTLSTGSSGTYTSRTMLSGGNTLSYQLYVDAGYTQVWGDGTGGTSVNSGSFYSLLLGSGGAAYAVYGQIPARQNVRPGSYTDTIIVTTTYY